MEDIYVSEAYYLLTEYCYQQGHRDIKDLEGCLEVQVNQQWWFAVNGHREPMKCSKDVEVLPFNIYLEYNGWPAGMVGPDGGVIAAGSEASEDDLIKALKEKDDEAEK